MKTQLVAISVAACLTAAPVCALAGPFSSLWKGWEYVDETEGIKIYKRQVEGSDLLDFGGESVFDADIGTMCTILRDIGRYKEWVDSLDDVGVLGPGKGKSFYYFQAFDLPWPISDRDFVVRQDLQVDPAKNLVLIRDVSVEHKRRPEHDCCIRATMELGEVRMVPLSEKRTAVSAIARIDFKGWLPAWLVNSIQEEFPRTTFTAYKKQLTKKVDVLPECQDLLAPKEAMGTTTSSTAGR